MTKAAQTVPTMRFKGFNGEWKKQRLDAVTEKIQDGTHFSPPLSDEGKYKYISARNIRNGAMLLHDMQFVDEAHHREIYKRSDVKFGDVLLTKDGASTGNVCLNELREEFSLLSSVAFIRADGVNSTSEFIYQYLFSPFGQSEVKAVIAGQAITRITLEKLRAFKFAFPTLPEQTKIAGFLGAVDGKIQQLTRKKALLEQYKKGVMQKIFNREIRFKILNGRGELVEPPEWEEKELGEIGQIITGKTPLTANEDLWGGDVQFITPTDIHEDRKYQVTTARQVQRNGKMKLLPPNSIVYTCIASIGKMALTVHPAITNQQINAIVPEPTVSNEYVYYVLLHMTPKIKSTQANTTLPIINKTDFSQITIPLPCLEEQQRIAGFLSALDGSVAAVAKQLEGAVRWKKGLLQQMFV